jgi:protein-S-isoprenylcysteine O-methyltransferase Ste14
LLGFLAAILPMIYFAGFLANLGVPRSIDAGPIVPPARALAIDLALLGSFALVHSLLARRPVKARVARLAGAGLERSLYSLVAGLQMVLLLVAWRPLPEPIWSVEPVAARAAILALFASGWLIVLAALREVGAAHLFGLTPAWADALGTPAPPPLAERGVYRWLRHPIYAGTLLTFWAAPDMSQGRFLLAAVFSIYLVVGLRLEERDLERQHGSRYRDYRRRVGGLVPRWSARPADTEPPA